MDKVPIEFLILFFKICTHHYHNFFPLFSLYIKNKEQILYIHFFFTYSVATLHNTYFTVKAKAANPMMTTRLVSTLYNGLWSLCNWSRNSEETSEAVDWCLACFSNSFLCSNSAFIVYKIWFFFINIFIGITLKYLFYDINTTSTVSGKSSQNNLSFKLYSKLCAANCFFS